MHISSAIVMCLDGSVRNMNVSDSTFIIRTSNTSIRDWLFISLLITFTYLFVKLFKDL